MSGQRSQTIAHYAVASHLGGGERSLLELVRRLARDGRYAPLVIVPAPGPLTEALGRDGVAFEVLPFPESFLKLSRGKPGLESALLGLRSLPGMGIYLARLARLLREREVRLLHTNAIKCHAVGALVGPALGIPVLWHLRDILPAGRTRAALRFIQRASGARIVANSRATAEGFRPGDASIEVVHNGLDPLLYAPRRNRLFNSRLGASESTPIVGIVGVLARWKGQSVFLRMARILADRGLDARFVVVGGEIYDTASDSGFGQELRLEARALGIEDRVLFTGFLKDPIEVMNGLDVLVHASVRPEPFGRVVIEGMACGVPVVASRDGGILEILEEGKTGLCAEPGNETELADAVGRLLLDPALRERLARAGRGEFERRFTSQAYVDGVVRIYEGLLGSR